MYNAYTGFSGPAGGLGAYIFVGFVPGVSNGVENGFKSNGQDKGFTNCDSNPSSYMAFYPNAGMSPVPTWGLSAYATGWHDSRTSEPVATGDKITPTTDYDFVVITGFGGCGCLDSSGVWSGATAAAIGFLFSE